MLSALRFIVCATNSTYHIKNIVKTVYILLLWFSRYFLYTFIFLHREQQKKTDEKKRIKSHTQNMCKSLF